MVRRDRNQTEFTRTLEDYLSIAASDERVSKGRAAFARHRSTLNAVEARYGVPANIVCAIWGLESFYGERRGDGTEAESHWSPERVRRAPSRR